MKTSVRSLAAIAAFSFLSACGGGAGGGSAVPGHTVYTGQSTQPVIQFFVPSAPVTSSSAARRANTLPSTTQSVYILVSTTPTGASTAITQAPITINTVAGSNGCQSVTGGLSCTESVTVPLGISTFSVVAYAGQNASGAAIAQGVTTATISAATTSVAITMNAQNIYVGESMAGGGLGQIVVDHTANTFTVNSGNGKITSGTISPLTNGDLKLVVTSATNNSATVGDIVYAREIAGSAMIFGDTGFTTVQANGSSTAGTSGDMGAGVAAQGCPTTGSSQTVSLATVPGPAWVAASSPAYTSGTAAITVASGTATVNFAGNAYTTSGSTVNSQNGSQVCSGGIFSATSQGSVAFSTDGVTVVSNGSNSAPSVNDAHEGGFGFAEATTPSISTISAGTYDGFVGGLGNVSGMIGSGESPFQLTPSSPGMMNACPYSNFEAGTVGTPCGSITFLSQGSQPGVINVSVNTGSGTGTGVVIVGQTSSGKLVMFGTVSNPNGGGNFVAFLQH